ncbi:MAG: helix-turn-helix domain-containing protein [Planctomycetota bacterium]
MAKSPNQFSPKQVAKSLQVSESSVKRWCDQGVIPTIRTVGGHRRITLSGLRKFLSETDRTLVDPQSLQIDAIELEAAGSAKPRRTAIPGEGSEPAQQEFRAALAEGDEDRCMEIINARIKLGWNRAEVAEDLIADAMRGLGEAWDCGDLEVYQERRSCNICTRVIYNLRESLPPMAEDAPVAIGAAPESDPYQLPSALVELALRECGWNAINLGNDLPLSSLIQAAKDYQPRLVWLSVTSVDDPSRFVREQNKLADTLGDEVSMIVGGRALDDKFRPKLRYTAHCDSLRHLIELAGILSR